MIIHNIHESLDMFFEFEFNIDYIIPETIEITPHNEVCFRYSDPRLAKSIMPHTKKRKDISFVVPFNPQIKDIHATMPSIPYGLEVKISEDEDKALREYIRKSIL